MVVTRQVVSNKLVAYLNRHIILAQLVDWAKDSVVDDDLEPAEDKEVLTGILAFLALATSGQARIIWGMCVLFLEKLGLKAEMAPVRNVNILNDVMDYPRVINDPQIPLTWGMYAQFLEKLGLKAQMAVTDGRVDLNP